jgi:hypothetical protein
VRNTYSIVEHTLRKDDRYTAAMSQSGVKTGQAWHSYHRPGFWERLLRSFSWFRFF